MSNRTKLLKRIILHIVPAIILTLLIIMSAVLCQAYMQFKLYKEEITDTLDNSLTAEKIRLAACSVQEMSLVNAITGFNRLDVYLAAGYAEQAEEISDDVMNELSNADGDASSSNSLCFSFYDAQGNLKYSSAKSTELKLSDEEKAELFSSQGCITGKETEIASYPCRDGYLVAQRVDTFDVGLANWKYSSSSLEEKVYLVNALGRAIDESLGSLQSSTTSSTASSSRKQRNRYFSDDDIAKITENVNTGEVVIDPAMKVLYMAVTTDDDQIVFATVSLTKVMMTTLKKTIVPAVLFIITGLTLLYYTLRMSRIHHKKVSKISGHRIAGRTHIDRTLVNHLAALVVVSLLITVILSSYIQILLFMSTFNIESTSDLQNIGHISEITDEISQNISIAASKEYKLAARLMKKYLYGTSEAITTEKLSVIAEDNPNVVGEISIFDNDGTLLVDSKASGTYTLEYSAEDASTYCVSLLTNSQDIVISQGDTGLSNIGGSYAAIPGANGYGIIRIYFVTEMSIWDTKYVSDYLSVVSAETGSGDKYVIYDEDTSVIVDAELNEIDNTLPEYAQQSGYTGFQYLDGTLRYITVQRFDTYRIICSKNVLLYLQVSIVNMILIFTAGYLLLTLELILTTALYNKDPAETGEETAEHENIFSQAFSKEKQLNRQFSNAIKATLTMTGLSLLIMLLVDWIINNNSSQISFLFGREWNYGINVFSVTIVMLAFIGEQILTLLLSKIIMLISINVGPKGKTIGKMMTSLLRMTMIIAVIFYAMVKFGVNVKTLLTGAGIMGAAVSFCAQSTVSDLISGLFMIFEGQVRVGDWVLVEGQKGQVREISIRTTTLERAGMLFIINNSKMSNVVVLDDASSGPMVEFSVAYNENVDEVIKLIENNKQLYRREIPEMRDGPWVLGVTELGDSGVQIKMYAKSSEKNAGIVERGMLRVTKKLFDLSGVEIPWPQVVVHNSEPVFHTKKNNGEGSNDHEEN